MRGSLIYLLFATGLTAATCMGQSQEEEQKFAKEVKRREARINSVLQLVLPRIAWNGLSYDDAWCSLEAMIRAAGPIEEGDLRYEWSPYRYEIEPDSFGNQSTLPPARPSEKDSALDSIWTNARDVKVVDAVRYLSDMKDLRFQVSGDPWVGLYFHLLGSEPDPESVELAVPAAVQALVKGEHLRNIKKSSEAGWMAEALGWKGNLVFGAGIDPSARIKWKDRDTKLAITSTTLEISKLRRHIASLNAEAISLGLVPLNKGDLRLVEMLEVLRKTKLQNLQIDAPNLGEALEKLRVACRANPGTGEAFLRWPFFDPKLATLGPVHFKLKDGSAAAALFPMLFELGCKFAARPDGRCGITTRQMGDGNYFEIRQWKVPASLMRAQPQKIKEQRQAKVPGAASRDIICGGGGVTFGNGEFAMYSAMSSTLIVKETAEGFLRLRKGFGEHWRKAGFSLVTK